MKIVSRKHVIHCGKRRDLESFRSGHGFLQTIGPFYIAVSNREYFEKIEAECREMLNRIQETEKTDDHTVDDLG